MPLLQYLCPINALNYSSIDKIPTDRGFTFEYFMHYKRQLKIPENREHNVNDDFNKDKSKITSKEAL